MQFLISNSFSQDLQLIYPKYALDITNSATNIDKFCIISICSSSDSNITRLNNRKTYSIINIKKTLSNLNTPLLTHLTIQAHFIINMNKQATTNEKHIQHKHFIINTLYFTNTPPPSSSITSTTTTKTQHH